MMKSNLYTDALFVKSSASLGYEKTIEYIKGAINSCGITYFPYDRVVQIECCNERTYNEMINMFNERFFSYFEPMKKEEIESIKIDRLYDKDIQSLIHIVKRYTDKYEDWIAFNVKQKGEISYILITDYQENITKESLVSVCDTLFRHDDIPPLIARNVKIECNEIGFNVIINIVREELKKILDMLGELTENENKIIDTDTISDTICNINDKIFIPNIGFITITKMDNIEDDEYYKDERCHFKLHKLKNNI